MRVRRNASERFGTIVVFAIIAIVIIIFNMIFSFNDHTYTVTITDKDRIVESHKKDDKVETTSKYLVFGDDQDGNSLVFENTDEFIRFKFNSSNIQGSLKEGHTYKITVIGYRVPFFSWYENIIKVEEVED